MCGIIIFKGKSIKKGNIFDSALKNEHRGSEDGFGFVDLTNQKITRTILYLDEIAMNDLSHDREKWKTKYKTILRERLKKVREELNEETNFIIFHHRKASAGSVSLKNTHPISIRKNISYCQNGTIEGHWLLKNYLEQFEGKKYTTTTDTELIARFIEQCFKEKISLKKTYERIKKLFETFGVVIRIDKQKKEMIIFKDWDRTLFLYEMDYGHLLISEPMYDFKKFKSCKRLDNCVVKITEKSIRIVHGTYRDVTKKLKEYLKKNKSNAYQCDVCKHKSTTLRFEVINDYCLCCLLTRKGLKGVDIKDEPRESFNIYRSYGLGGLVG